jgi:hypothetical protein
MAKITVPVVLPLKDGAEFAAERNREKSITITLGSTG